MKFALALLSLLAMTPVASAGVETYTFAGEIWDGTTSSALANTGAVVTISYFDSTLGEEINENFQVTTDGTGWFQLQVTVQADSCGAVVTHVTGHTITHPGYGAADAAQPGDIMTETITN